MIESRLLRAISAIVEHILSRKLLGPFRYRVIAMVGDLGGGTERVTLQAVRKEAGLPDVQRIPIHPGMAGLKADLTPGSIVLVEFIEGDPALPILTHFTRADEPGFLPVSVTLDATDTVRIGPSASRVELAGGSETTLTATGRVVRWGDIAAGPAALGAPYTLQPAVPGTTPVSKARA